jgi:hypothetical protein
LTPQLWRVERRPGRPQPRDVIGATRVCTVRLRAQEPLFDERVERDGTRIRIQTAKTVDLIKREPKAWHLEEFGAQTFDGVRHDDLAQLKRNPQTKVFPLDVSIVRPDSMTIQEQIRHRFANNLQHR